MSLRASFFRHFNNPLLLCFLVFISYAAILALRIHNIEFRYGAFTDCRGCFVKPILIHEARLGGIWIILLALGMYLKRAAISVPLRIAVVIVLVIQLADVVLMSTLSSRLYTDSIGKVPVSLTAILDFVHGWATQRLGEAGTVMFLAWILLILAFLAAKSRMPARAASGMVISGTLVSLCGFLIPDHSAYMLASSRDNFIELNLPRGQYLPYSGAFRDSVLKSALQDPECTCIKGRDSRKNIILLVVESLSDYQSNFFSGQMNLTPNLDRIAREHKSFTHFHANSFHTINGLEALLTGMPPIPSADEESDNLAVSLPNYLKAYHYRTHYMTPAKFELLKNDGVTLKAMGFDEIEGRTSFYDGAPELQFGAAPDDVFYQRILKALDAAAKEQKNNPGAALHFWTFMTGGTHQPFNRKNVNNSSLPSAFRFADEELGQFYQALLKRNFFSNGVLIITGDHHSMTPISSREYERFGLEATSLVPLVIVEGEQQKPEIIRSHFQQADLFQSIQFLVQKDVCVDASRGNLFGGESDGPECVFFERGDERDQVNYFCRQGQGTIRLDGDKTSFIGTAPPNAASILNQLHHERIGALRERLQTRMQTACLERAKHAGR